MAVALPDVERGRTLSGGAASERLETDVLRETPERDVVELIMLLRLERLPPIDEPEASVPASEPE